MKVSKRIFPFLLFFVMVACQAEKKTVQEAFKKVAPPILTNPHNASFKNNATGIYTLTDTR
ncbi:MAG: hypothetical protein ACRCTJ_01015, partial [Brevinema sp.]